MSEKRSKAPLIITAFLTFVLGLVLGYAACIAKITYEAKSLMDEVYANLDSLSSDENMQPVSDLVVRVSSSQFAWHFQYARPDGKLGPCKLELVTEENPVGIDRQHPDAQDDWVSQELVLPCNSEVTLALTSTDVIHALGYLPDFYQQDAIPGKDRWLSYPVPDQPLTGTLRCVQLCGTGHDNHTAPYQFVGNDEYKDWTTRQRFPAKP
ncbi:hypothetical protein Rhal01_03497 [Rubritalea halochordaticola]|uniref:Cytochrome oxidase subunit II copper A binding domain-containing protein n=1 Tax=Rubritalea halochordaticola TaxID=714537 RepID=A0ABP9V5Z5_9BACT